MANKQFKKLNITTKDNDVLTLYGVNATTLDDISTLQADLKAESKTRESADQSLNTAISNETSARIEVDTALQTSIDNVSASLTTETADRTTADQTLNTAISSESSSRQTAVNNLQSQIDEIKKSVEPATIDYFGMYPMNSQFNGECNMYMAFSDRFVPYTDTTIPSYVTKKVTYYNHKAGTNTYDLNVQYIYDLSSDSTDTALEVAKTLSKYQIFLITDFSHPIAYVSFDNVTENTAVTVNKCSFSSLRTSRTTDEPTFMISYSLKLTTTEADQYADEIKAGNLAIHTPLFFIRQEL